MEVQNEVQQILEEWTKRTTDLFLQEIHRKKVGYYKGKSFSDEELRKSVSSNIHALGKGYLVAEFLFPDKGRFVDMGVGRGKKIGKSVEKVTAALATRKPKVWYSRALYGRVNDLQGVIGLKMMENAMAQLKNALEK